MPGLTSARASRHWAQRSRKEARSAAHVELIGAHTRCAVACPKAMSPLAVSESKLTSQAAMYEVPTPASPPVPPPLPPPLPPPEPPPLPPPVDPLRHSPAVQTRPKVHAEQTTPPVPQVESAVPGSQRSPLQQPPQVVGVQMPDLGVEVAPHAAKRIEIGSQNLIARP